MQLRSILQLNLAVDDILLDNLMREATNLLNLFSFNIWVETCTFIIFLNLARSSNHLLVNCVLIFLIVKFDGDLRWWGHPILAQLAIYCFKFDSFSSTRSIVRSNILGRRHLVRFLFQQYSKTVHQVILLLDGQISFPNRVKSPVFLLQ